MSDEIRAAAPAPPTGVASTRPTPAQWAMLAGILIVAAVLRFIYISANEAHFDEVWHLEISTGRGEAHTQLPRNVLIPAAPDLTSLADAPPWYTIFTTLSGQTHPPLHFLALRGWRELLGDSLTAGRALSAVLSVLCVLAMFDAARQACTISVALWAALLMALSLAQVEQAQEVRGYPLLILLSLCAALALLRIERAGPSLPRVAALALSVVAMLYTHYFAIPAIVAMGVYALLRLRGRDRRQALAALVGACVFAAATWGPMVLRQREAFSITGAPGAYFDDRPDHVRATAQRAAVAPLRLLFEPRPDNAVVAVLSGSVLLLPWLVLRRRPPVLLLWALWLVAVIGFAAALDLTRGTRHLDAVRHTILAGAAMFVILPLLLLGMTGSRDAGGAGAALVPPAKAAHGLVAMVAAACAAALPLSYTRPAVGLSAIGRHLAAARGTDEPVVFYSEPPRTWWTQWLMLSAMHYSRAFPRPAALLDRPADPALLEQLRRWDSVWVVYNDTRLRPPQILGGCRVVWARDEPFVGRVARVRWVDRP